MRIRTLSNMELFLMKVFINYSKEDFKTAKRLYDDLGLVEVVQVDFAEKVMKL